MKIKKSEPLSWLCIGASLFFMAGLIFFKFDTIIQIILMIFVFASLFGIVVFSKRKEQLNDVIDVNAQIKEQEEIIKENINTIKNAQQDFWEAKRNDNIDYDDERLNLLRQIKQKHFVISTPTKILNSEYLDLTNNKSPFEQQLFKKHINNKGYLDLTLPEHQSEETIKHKIDKMLKAKNIKVTHKNNSPQTKHHDDVVKNVDKDKTEDISISKKEDKLKDEECVDLTKIKEDKKDITL